MPTLTCNKQEQKGRGWEDLSWAQAADLCSVPPLICQSPSDHSEIILAEKISAVYPLFVSLSPGPLESTYFEFLPQPDLC